MKVTKTVYILAGTDKYNGGEISISGFDLSNYHDDKILVATQEVEFDVPEFDIVNIQIDGIDKQIAKIRAVAQMEVNGLEQRKQELLAIGHEVTA
jgi:predicted ABC-type transport system involved in lysophospholipase L1 biosynthesis ATPase subunit